VTPWIALDIETASRPEWLATQVPAGLAPEEVPPWVAAHAGDGALSPWTGQVTAWAIATSDGAEESHCTGDEREALSLVYDALCDLNPAVIVAHNGDAFDFPFVRHRGIARRMPMLAAWFHQDKPWSGRLIDTAGPSWTPRPAHGRPRDGWLYSLDAVAGLVGVEPRPTIGGAEVPRAWYAGRFEEVRVKCLNDVRTLAEVYPRLAEARS
jgi:DNA polymerase elongation subunit (family B)